MKKKILIIGGSSGIGRELVNILKNECSLVLASRNPEAVNDPDIATLSIDVTGESPDLSSLPDTLDGFVYCPGSINLKPFRMLSAETFEKDMEINFFGLVRVLKEIMPLFNPGASLVFFSTVAVGSGMPFHTSVAAAKGAIEGFARALAAEYAPQLRVNVIAPSLVDTPLAKRLLNNEKKQQMMAERHPLKRVGTAQDIARMAAFLLREDSSWMTGQVLGVDGGISTLNVG